MSLFGFRLTLWGLGLALLAIAAYLCYRHKCKKSIDLAAAVNVAISMAGAVGGGKMMVFAFSPQFEMAAAASSGAWWSISEGDALFVAIGGMALVWVSFVSMWKAFRE